jgi:hypothetical protein
LSEVGEVTRVYQDCWVLNSSHLDAQAQAANAMAMVKARPRMAPMGLILRDRIPIRHAASLFIKSWETTFSTWNSTTIAQAEKSRVSLTKAFGLVYLFR